MNHVSKGTPPGTGHAPGEEPLDRLTTLAARILRVPVALVSLVDADLHFVKSSVGMAGGRGPAPAFCLDAASSGELLVIPDARTDPRAAGTAGVDLVALACVPLKTEAGEALGTFCAIDSRPRAWTDAEMDVLESLAAAATAEVELRRRMGELEQATSALRESERRFHTVVESLGEGVLLTDRDDRILYVNARMTELSGYPEGEMLGRVAHELLLEGDGREAFLRIAGGAEPRYAADLARRGGGCIRVEIGGAPYRDDSGEVVGTVGTVTDVTERSRVETALAREREFLRAVLENLEDGVVACDADGVLTVFNRAATDFHGRNAVHQGAESWREVYSVALGDGRPLPEGGGPLSRALRGETVHNLELVITPPGAPPRRLVTSGQTLRDSAGRVLGAVATLHDVTRQRRAEEALREEHEFATRVMSAMGEGLVVTNPAGEIVYANPAFGEMVGRDPEELVGLLAPVVLVDEEGRPPAFDISGERLLHRADGERRHVLISSAPRTGERDGGTIAVVRDLSRGKEMESALLASEERYRGLVESASDLIFATDGRGRFTYANPTMTRLLGRTEAELLGRPYLELVHPEARAEVEEFYARQATERSPSTYHEIRVVPADGRDLWLGLNVRMIPDAAGEPRIQAVARDVTDQRHAEDALRRSEAHNRAIVDAIPDQIFWMDVRGMCVGSKPGRDGAETEVAAGVPLHETLPPTIAGAFTRAAGRALATGSVQTVTYELTRAERIRAFEARVVRSGSEEAMVIVRDVTEQREVERLKNEFVSVVSHELRTPLTSLRGSLGLLGSGKLSGVQAQRMLDVAVQNTDRLVRLINDILDTERLESGAVVMEPRPVGSGELVAQAAEAIRGLADRAGVALVVEADDLVVNADPDRVMQVLVNLLSNAVKFSPPGSRVRVRAELRGDEVLFAVDDRGRGIPADKLEHIFERFRQVDSSDAREKGGSGLGLPIARTIVQQHGGRIWASSEPGAGSTFWFTLPTPGNRADEPIPAEGAEAVLVCGSDAAECAALAALLGSEGFAAESIDAAAVAGSTALRAPRVLVLAGGGARAMLASLRARPELRDTRVVLVGGEREDAAGGEWVADGGDRAALVAALRRATGRGGRAGRVLVVESDPELLRALTEGLQRRAVDVHGTGDPAEAIRLAQGMVPDLLVLDVGLPGDGGFRVAEWLRHHARLHDVRVVVSSATELSSAQRARVRLGPTEFVNRLRLSPAALEQRVMAMLSGATGAPDRLPTTRS